MPEDGSRQIKWSLTQRRQKQLLIATRQKLQNVNQLTLDLYVNGVTEGFSTFERFEH